MNLIQIGYVQYIHIWIILGKRQLTHTTSAFSSIGIATQVGEGEQESDQFPVVFQLLHMAAIFLQENHCCEHNGSDATPPVSKGVQRTKQWNIIWILAQRI